MVGLFVRKPPAQHILKQLPMESHLLAPRQGEVESPLALGILIESQNLAIHVGRGIIRKHILTQPSVINGKHLPTNANPKSTNNATIQITKHVALIRRWRTHQHKTISNVNANALSNQQTARFALQDVQNRSAFKTSKHISNSPGVNPPN